MQNLMISKFDKCNKKMFMKNFHALSIYWPFKVKFIIGLITS